MVEGAATPAGGIMDANSSCLVPLSSGSYRGDPTVETWLPSPIEEGLTEHLYRRSIIS